MDTTTDNMTYGTIEVQSIQQRALAQDVSTTDKEVLTEGQ